MTTIPKAMCLLYKKRLNSIYDGNISHKKSSSRSFVISPGSVRKHTIQDEELVLVKTSEDDILSWDIGKKPSREVMLHSLSLFDTDDELYVVHCHPPNILRFIRDNELRDIKTTFPEIEYNIGENVNYYTAGSERLAKETQHKLKGNDIIALEKHGVVGKGKDLLKIVDMIEVIDFYCNI